MHGVALPLVGGLTGQYATRRGGPSAVPHLSVKERVALLLAAEEAQRVDALDCRAPSPQFSGHACCLSGGRSAARRSVKKGAGGGDRPCARSIFRMHCATSAAHCGTVRWVQPGRIAAPFFLFEEILRVKESWWDSDRDLQRRKQRVELR